MQNTFPLLRIVACALSVVWCYVAPSINFIAICFFALLVDCYTAWRCNRRIYAKYKEQLQRNPKYVLGGRLRSKKMWKMVQDFTVLILGIFLATAIDNGILGHMGELHLANYLAALYCAVQFVSILENESTCNGAEWAKVLQKIVADKTERHYHINLRELMDEEQKQDDENKDNADKQQ